MAPTAGPPSVALSRLAILSGAFGGLALVASTFLAWPAKGAGSGLAAHRMADLLMSDAAEPFVPRWLGLAVYIVPVAGAVLIVASGLDLGSAWLLKAAALAVAGLITILTVVALPKRHLFDLGPGARVALLGVVFGVLSVLADRWSTGPRRPEEETCTSA